MLRCKQYLSVDWRPIDQGPFQASFLNATNADTLRAVLAVEHAAVEHGEEPPDLALELHCLELKVDLLTRLVGQWVAKDLSIPPPTEVVLGVGDIEWIAETAPVVGQSILVVLYPNPMYPLPVRLQGLVEQLTKAGERYRIKVRFAEI